MHELRGAAWVAATLLLSVPALADPTRDECVDANTRAQTLRQAGKLSESRAQLEICVSPSCPAIVRQDCTERLDEVNRASPSVLFDVTDAAGNDLAATHVTMDGKPLVERLDGKYVMIDPGEHTFVFTTTGHLPKTLHAVVHEGDKQRRIKVQFGAAAEDEPAPEVKPSEPPQAPHNVELPPAEEAETHSSPGNGQRVAAVVVGSVGVVGLGLGIAFAAAAASTWSTSKSECNTTSCPDRPDALIDHDNAYNLATASTVAFIAGGVLAASGLIWFIAAPRKHSGESALHVTPVLGARVAGLSIGGTF